MEYKRQKIESSYFVECCSSTSKKFILPIYSVGREKQQRDQTKNAIYFSFHFFECFHFTWRICIKHVLFAFPYRYLLLLFNSVLNNISWIIEKKRWMDFVFHWVRLSQCLNNSLCLYACIYVSTKYTQIHTREKICVHCIPTINLNEKHISLVRFVTIFSLDGFVPFHFKYPNSKMLREFVLAVIVVTVVSCWVNDLKRRRVIESERERENGNCTKEYYEFSLHICT